MIFKSSSVENFFLAPNIERYNMEWGGLKFLLKGYSLGELLIDEGSIFNRRYRYPQHFKIIAISC